MKNSSFCHLHLHTDFSILDGLGKASEYAERAKEMKFKYLAITDHGAIDNTINFQNECLKRDIIGIIGCELYLTSYDDFKGKSGHCCVFVKNEIGWRNLCQILSIANLDHFYRKPRIDFNILYDLCEGLVCTTACAGSWLKLKDGIPFFHKLHKKIGGDLYLEIMPHHLDVQDEVNAICLDLHKKTSVKLISTVDAHYVRKEDHLTHDVLLCIQTKTTMDNPNRFRFDFEGSYLQSCDEILENYATRGIIDEKTVKRSLFNTLEIAEKCKDFRIPKHEITLPDYRPFPDLSPKQNLKKLYLDMAEERLGFSLSENKEYRDRAKMEYEVITEKNFETYFLVLYDIVNFCKQNQILTGIGRGSVGGSLLAFILGITEIDPIKYDLIFERFLNRQRNDYPDIDLDVPRHRREEVRQYLVKKYGENCIAGVSTFAYLKGRSVIKDVSRVFGVDLKEVDLFAKSMEQKGEDIVKNAVENSEEGKLFAKKYPKVVDIAQKLEGTVRGCLTGDCYVLTSNGLKKLKDILVGDSVVSHTGQYKRVSNTIMYKNKDEKLLCVRAKFGDASSPIKMTKDHKVLAVKRKMTESYYRWINGDLKRRPTLIYENFKNDDLEWIRADELVIGDVVFTPWIKNREIEDILNIDLSKYFDKYDSDYVFYNTLKKNYISEASLMEKYAISKRAWENTKNGISRTINKVKVEEALKNEGINFEKWRLLKNNNYKEFKVKKFLSFDNDFCEMVGRWIGDGHLSFKSEVNKTYRWGLTFNITEIDELKKYIAYFDRIGIQTSIKDRSKNNAMGLNIYCQGFCRLFADIFSDYHQTSTTKYIPDIFKRLPEDKIKSLISGLIEADGYVSIKRSSETIGTNSMRLKNDIRECLHILKIPSNCTYCKPKEKLFNGKLCLCKENFSIRFSGITIDKNKIREKFPDRNEGFYSQIFEIYETEPESVFDITVDGDNSYVTSNYTVHNSSQHASAVIISKNDLYKSGQCTLRKKDHHTIINWDMNNCEKNGLIKFDLLGLTQLSVIGETIKLVKEIDSVELKITDFLNPDDQEVFSLLSGGDTSGVFQLNTWTMTNYIKKLVINKFDDMIAAVALVRPGASDSGVADEYLLRKHGKTWEPKHPIYEDITKDTYGLIPYQEQIMFMFTRMAGLSFSIADSIRKIIGKKRDVREFDQYKDMFVNGCLKEKTMTKAEALQFWTELEASANYMFNKSHSVGYALLAYITAWLKTHYPAYFYCANLTMGEDDKKDHIVKSAYNCGLEVKLPKVGYSKASTWTVNDNILLAPFSEIKGLGEKQAIEASLEIPQKFKPFSGFYSTPERSKNETKIKKLLTTIGSWDYNEKPKLEVQELFEFPISNDLEVIGKTLLDLCKKKYSEEIIYKIFNGKKYPEIKLIQNVDRDFYEFECNGCSLNGNPFETVFGDKNIMIITEHPSYSDANQNNKLFSCNMANEVLMDLYDIGVNYEDLTIACCTKCFPGKGRKPIDEQKNACAKHLEKEIFHAKPKIILALGRISVEFFNPEARASEFYGKFIWSERYKSFIFYGYSTGFAYIGQDNKMKFKKSLKKFYEMVKRNL